METGPHWPPSGGLLRLGQVVDGDTAHGLRGEVRRDPGRDRRGTRTTAEAVAAAADVVVDLALGHQGLELRQRRRRVAAVEPADREYRLTAGRQFDRSGFLRPLGRRDPLVLRGVLPEQLDQGAADLRATGQAPHAASPAGPTAGPAAREPARRAPGPSASASPSASAGPRPSPGAGRTAR